MSVKIILTLESQTLGFFSGGTFEHVKVVTSSCLKPLLFYRKKNKKFQPIRLDLNYQAISP